MLYSQSEAMSWLLALFFALQYSVVRSVSWILIEANFLTSKMINLTALQIFLTSDPCLCAQTTSCKKVHDIDVEFEFRFSPEFENASNLTAEALSPQTL
jgi:hypothetical protein